jgi:hypothetical protein
VRPRPPARFAARIDAEREQMTRANAANEQAGLPEREVLLHWRTVGAIATVCAAGCAVTLLAGVIVNRVACTRPAGHAGPPDMCRP